MTGTEKKEMLAQYRLKQAGETLEEADFLLKSKKNPRSVMNRIYYSMFYSILALLVYEPYSSSKHKGVIAYFNKKFIREGIFPKDLGKTLNKAYELRLSGDYEEYMELTIEQVEPYIDGAKKFIQEIQLYISKKK